MVVGGENRWKYDTFVNWDFLPSEDFPILVYFRETQTPASSREEVPLVVDELDGQVHVRLLHTGPRATSLRASYGNRALAPLAADLKCFWHAPGCLLDCVPACACLVWFAVRWKQFFPAISDAQQLKAQFTKHACAKI